MYHKYGHSDPFVPHQPGQQLTVAPCGRRLKTGQTGFVFVTS